MQAIALREALTARGLATTMGFSLRKAQNALEQLAAQGTCTEERQGRAFEYRIEDATFAIHRARDERAEERSGDRGRVGAGRFDVAAGPALVSR